MVQKEDALGYERRVVLKSLALRLAVSVAVLAALPGLAFLTDRATSEGRVLRGVWVSTISLSGLDRDETRREVAKLADRLRRRSLDVRVGDRVLTIEPADLGFELDVDATTQKALAQGRVDVAWLGFGWWLSRLGRPTQLEPVVKLDTGATERIIEELENREMKGLPFDGGITVKDGKPTPEYPRTGYVVDREAAHQRLIAALASDREEVVDLPLVAGEPRLGKKAVDAAVQIAKRLLRGNVRLIASDSDDEVTLTAGDLAHALATRSHVRPRRYLEVYFDATKLDEKLRPIRENIEREPIDATFRVGQRDDVHVVPGRPGVQLDPALLADAVLFAAASPGRRGILPLDRAARPARTTEQLRALGVKELVSKFTTYHPCCRPRVENIHRIADLLDGVIVEPGETFSVNEHVGPRTRKNGFILAPTIEHGEMVDSVGGGISQFATTLFNAVLHGGYGIVERQPHSYYFSRYPEGHEATLSYPEPDLKFKNDTKAGMLIKCDYGKTFIRVRIFGDKEGRRVATHVGKRTDIKQPPVEFIPNPKIDPEEEEVVERGQIGWTVIVSRTVRYADGTEKSEQRKVIYSPRVRRLQVHPCRIPEGEEGYTGEECPVPEDESLEADDSVSDQNSAEDAAADSIEPGSDLDEGF